MLLSLLHVFEEDPLVEATALGPLAARFRNDLPPAHVMDRREGLEHFQHVSQFRHELPVRRCLRFMRLLQQLRPQGGLVSSMLQDPGNRLTPVGGNDRRDPIADELVVGDAHALDSTARLIT